MTERYVQLPIPELAYLGERSPEEEARLEKVSQELARHAFFSEIYPVDSKDPDEKHNYLFD